MKENFHTAFTMEQDGWDQCVQNEGSMEGVVLMAVFFTIIF